MFSFTVSIFNFYYRYYVLLAMDNRFDAGWASFRYIIMTCQFVLLCVCFSVLILFDIP